MISDIRNKEPRKWIASSVSGIRVGLPRELVESGRADEERIIGRDYRRICALFAVYASYVRPGLFKIGIQSAGIGRLMTNSSTNPISSQQAAPNLEVSLKLAKKNANAKSAPVLIQPADKERRRSGEPRRKIGAEGRNRSIDRDKSTPRILSCVVMLALVSNREQKFAGSHESDTINRMLVGMIVSRSRTGA
jgi:hypothetical protein